MLLALNGLLVAGFICAAGYSILLARRERKQQQRDGTADVPSSSLPSVALAFDEFAGDAVTSNPAFASVAGDDEWDDGNKDDPLPPPPPLSMHSRQWSNASSDWGE